ncbi:hypothetical protein IV500_08300 [Paeniglutamicibacter antarcticus]|uniref:Uncharacterized protein n=1 Tax=Arthrobacter terrae TaxID=2935737 RepID=A0A931CQZ3_9MICC|nr:hypothetical protein [Arthrobacter terrae]MBG0739389.1 hypothetical protein [Arthrobacter terrae]
MTAALNSKPAKKIVTHHKRGKQQQSQPIKKSVSTKLGTLLSSQTTDAFKYFSILNQYKIDSLFGLHFLAATSKPYFNSFSFVKSAVFPDLTFFRAKFAVHSALLKKHARTRSRI